MAKGLFILAVAALTLTIGQKSAQAFCFEEAGQMYNIAPSVLWAIAKGESEFSPTAISWNTNGSYDFGVMQINSEWAKSLGKERWAQLAEPCTNVKVGAWILAQCIRRHGNTWEAIGCYNASSEAKRAKYARKVYGILKKAGIYGN